MFAIGIKVSSYFICVNISAFYYNQLVDFIILAIFNHQSVCVMLFVQHRPWRNDLELLSQLTGDQIGHSQVDFRQERAVLNRSISRSVCQIERKYPFHS